MAHRIAGAATHQGCRRRIGKQDRQDGLGHDGQGRKLSRTRRTCGVDEITPTIGRDVKVGEGKQHVMQSRRSGDQDNPLVPSHHRMRVVDRDLIRGGHYGQRSCEPHSKAEHMAAPTKPANVKIPLANSEPSTHGTFRQMIMSASMAAIRGKGDLTADISEMTKMTPPGGQRRRDSASIAHARPATKHRSGAFMVGHQARQQLFEQDLPPRIVERV
jgi:hypothetical protein